MERFSRKISSMMLLSSESERELMSVIEVFNVDKRGIIVEAGVVCDRLFFVNKGLTRTFTYNYGKEFTEGFASEGSFFTSWKSFLERTIGRSVIETLAPTVLYSVSFENLTRLCAIYPDINQLYHKIKNEVLLESITVSRAVNSMNASERYEWFVQSYPQVIKQTPLMYIASYLGITPETLSRVRCNKVVNGIHVSSRIG